MRIWNSWLIDELKLTNHDRTENCYAILVKQFPTLMRNNWTRGNKQYTLLVSLAASKFITLPLVYYTSCGQKNNIISLSFIINILIFLLKQFSSHLLNIYLINFNFRCLGLLGLFSTMWRWSVKQLLCLVFVLTVFFLKINKVKVSVNKIE